MKLRCHQQITQIRDFYHSSSFHFINRILNSLFKIMVSKNDGGQYTTWNAADAWSNARSS